MSEVRTDGRSGTVEHGVRGHHQSVQFLLDASKAGFEPVAAVAHLPQGVLEDLGPVPPLVPFLHAQQDRVDVDHRG